MTILQRVLVQNLREAARLPGEERRKVAAEARARHLRHAAEHAPFYRPIAPLLSAAADGDEEAWSRIPILPPDTPPFVAASWLAGALPADDMRLADRRSWTSLGTPLAGAASMIGEAADKAEWERWLLGLGFGRGTTLAALLPPAALQKGDLTAGLEPWSQETGSGGGRRFRDDLPAAVLRDLVADCEPQVLFCDGEALGRLLDGIEPGALGFAEIVASTPLPRPEGRELCRRHFAARLHEVLSSPLAGFVAGGDGDAYAAATDTQRIEIVDPDGRACEPGRPGRLLATPYHAALRPLLRLDLGRMAVWAGPPEEARFRLV